MTNAELNSALLDKMREEQATYRSWLIRQPPEEILKHTFEFTVRADILAAVHETGRRFLVPPRFLRLM